MDSRGFDYIDACRQASVKLSDRQYFIVFELVLFLSVSAQTPVNRILFLIILCVKIQPNALCVNSFKTKSGRNCIQLFFGFFCNRLKYLKCPLKWEVHCVCLLLFMGSQIASVIYLLFILTHCIFYSACSLYLPCLFPPSLPLYLPFHWQSLSFFPSLFFFHFWSLFKNLHPFTLVHAPVSLYLLGSVSRSSGGPVVRLGALVEMQRDLWHRDRAEAEAL